MAPENKASLMKATPVSDPLCMEHSLSALCVQTAAASAALPTPRLASWGAGCRHQSLGQTTEAAVRDCVVPEPGRQPRKEDGLLSPRLHATGPDLG